MNNCISNRNDRKCVVEENGKSAVFNNPEGAAFDLGTVDGCLIADERERCDFFFRLEHKIYLIELKGRDVGKAVSQICSTIDHLPNEIGKRRITPVIVTSTSPAISAKQKYLLAFAKYGKSLSGEIVLRTRTCSIKI